MVDLVISWFKIIELPLTEVTCKLKDKEIVEVALDKPSACLPVSALFKKKHGLLSAAISIIYDSNSGFKLFFQRLCETSHLYIGQPLLRILKQI
jgi:hypothetical protein